MTKPQRTLALIAAAVGSIPVVFLVAWGGFDAMVRSEYASGERVSTDGDSIIIPVVGVTVAWLIVLLAVAGVVGIIVQVRRARRGPA
jgi:TRAP-type mannitol/chloroaromatic compound transport system permease small subunit